MPNTEVGIQSGAVVDASGATYFGAQDGYVYALNADGSIRWVVPIGQDVDAPPAILPDGTLLVAADDYQIHAFR